MFSTFFQVKKCACMATAMANKRKNNLCLSFLSIDRTLEFATYLHLNAPFQTDITNDRICAK